MRITLRQNWWKLLAIVSVLATSLFGQNAQDETATQGTSRASEPQTGGC